MQKITDYKENKTLGGSTSVLWGKWGGGCTGRIQGHEHFDQSSFFHVCFIFEIVIYFEKRVALYI